MAATNKFKTAYGTGCPLTASTVFMKSKVRITIPTDYEAHGDAIQSLRAHIESDIRREVSADPYWHRNLIAMVEISDKGLRYRDTCFLKYEAYLRPAAETTWERARAKMEALSDKINSRVAERLARHKIAMS